MDLQGSPAQRDRTSGIAIAWAEEAAQITRELNSIVTDQYHGLVAMINEDVTPEELTALEDIWVASTQTIDECVDAVAKARQEIASIEAMGKDIARIDDAWLAHRAANVARSLVKTRRLYVKMGEQSEEYNRICASIRMKAAPRPPEGWEPPRERSADLEGSD